MSAKGIRNKWSASCISRKRNHISHPNKDMDDIIRIIKSLENSVEFIAGVSEKIKHEVKRTKRRIS